VNAAHSTAVVTVATRGHFHRARCLLASVRRHLPDAARFVVLADADDDHRLDAQDVEIVPVAALPIPDVAGFAARYRAPELCFATKPWALAEMFRRGFDRAIYFDADVVVYSSLAPMQQMLDAASILLTPHLAEPPADGVGATEITIVRAGAYNAGFLGLARGASANAFLNWWQRKLLHDCRVDVDRGYVGDQRWLDLVPGMFDGVRVVRHPGWNVGRWNLDRRAVTTVNGEVRVAGEPLVFFHYSGLLSGDASPGQLRDPEAIAPLGPAVKALIDDYVAELERQGARKYAHLPLAFTRSPAAARATARYRIGTSARHLLHAVTTTAFRRRARLWLRSRAAR
jgi:hypothetical protein